MYLLTILEVSKSKQQSRVGIAFSGILFGLITWFYHLLICVTCGKVFCLSVQQLPPLQYLLRLLDEFSEETHKHVSHMLFTNSLIYYAFHILIEILFKREADEERSFKRPSLPVLKAMPYQCTLGHMGKVHFSVLVTMPKILFVCFILLQLNYNLWHGS